MHGGAGGGKVPRRARALRESLVCASAVLSEVVESEEDGPDEEESRDGVIPAQVLAEVERYKDAEHDECDDFLNHLELNGAEVTGTDAVGGNLEAVFEEGDYPAYENDFPQGFATKPEVSVPGKRHEDVGDDEKNDCPHLEFGRLGFWQSCRNLLRMRFTEQIKER